MRAPDECPVCKSEMAGSEKRVFEGEAVLVYYHEGTSFETQYCIEHPDGIGETIRLPVLPTERRSA